MARLISNKKSTKEYLIKWLNSSLDKLGDDDSMTVWLLDELNRNSILKSLPNTLDISRENLIPRLTKAFIEEEIVLVLGAGVSMQFGLPGWNELLQNIMITTIEEEHDKAALLAKLFSVMFNPNSLIAGRYLQNYYNDKKSNFNEIVRGVIYESIDMSKPSSLMDEIVNLCVSPGRFPNIDSVITYNYNIQL